MNQNLMKLMTGVGITGLVTLVIKKISGSGNVDKVHFDMITPNENAALSTYNSVVVALDRLEVFASAQDYPILVTNMARLTMLSLAPHPTTWDIRHAEVYVGVIKHCLDQIHQITATRTHYHAEVLTELDELCSILTNTTNDIMFNMHNSYAPV